MFRLPHILIYVLAIGLLLVGCFAVTNYTQSQYKAYLRAELESALRNNRHAVANWVETRTSEVLAHSQDPDVLNASLDLLPLKKDKMALLRSPAQAKLRRFFNSFLYQQHVNGYFLIAPDGTSLASSRDSNIGTPNLLIAQPETFQRVLNGEALLTQLTRSDLTHANSNDIRDTVTNFAAAPLMDAQGNTVAVLALRLFPQHELFRIMQFVDTSDSSATYAFSRHGALLSDVEDMDSMRAAGHWIEGYDHLLLAPEQSGRFSPQIQRLAKPIRHALRGDITSDISGYDNYAGQKVVGAWHFFDDLNFGLIVEQPLDAAYAPIETLKFATVTAFGLGGAVMTFVFLWLQAARRKVHAHQNRVITTLNATRDVNFLVDADGYVQLANPALQAVFGMEPDLSIGTHISRFIELPPDENIRWTKSSLRTLVHARSSHTIRCNGVSHAGQRFPVGINIEPLTQRGQAKLEFLIVVHDYREIVQREAELRQALTQAEAGNRSKSSFLSTISHELRSPLLSVIAAIELLAERATSQDDNALLHSSKRSTQQLISIIDDILDYSRIEAQTLELSLQPTNLEDVLSDALQIHQLAAADSNVQILPYCSPDLPLLQADGLRIRQIISNLLSNAIKFSADLAEPGRVQVSLSATRAGDTMVSLQLTVTDNGVGITPDVMHHIFDPFTQADGSIRREFGGTGLGLTISDRLIKMMNGQISVISDPREGPQAGATFSVTLPLDIADAKAPSAPVLKGKTVGVVSCDDTVTDTVQRYVKAAGGDVLSVRLTDLSTLSAEALKDLDIMIWAATEQDHTPLLPADVPVLNLQLSSAPDAPEVADALPANMLLPGKFIAKITALLAPNPQSQPTSPQEHRQILLIEDDDMTREITLKMLKQLGIDAAAAQNGADGLQQWRTGRFNLLLSDCHMPIMDGFQMAAAIRAEESKHALPQVPIIAVSADMTMEIERLCQECEINEYVPKPLTPQKLRTLLETHITPTDTTP